MMLLTLQGQLTFNLDKNYGILAVVIMLVIDKIILTESFVSWIAGDFELTYTNKRSSIHF